MPVSPHATNSEPTDCLRAYRFHGMDLTLKSGFGVGDCPFCGKEGKFSAHAETGLWRCWSCGGGTEKGGGNPLTFLRLLHAAAVTQASNKFYEAVCADRRLCDTSTPAYWGVVRSPVPPRLWLVAGYSPDGSLHQLYKRTWVTEGDKSGWLLLPTPGVWPEGKSHGLHLSVSDFDPSAQEVLICEGPWDGMALWEVTHGPPCQVLATPGCNVWRDEWTKFCVGKHITLLYDSDHPRENGARAGYDGMVRVAKRLTGYAASIRWLVWGPDGYNSAKPSGWDIRDILSGAPGPPLAKADRSKVLVSLMNQVQYVPADLLPPTSSANGKAHSTSIEPKDCKSWDVCEAAWKGAMHWRSDMSDALAVILAVCASTNQSGNQLFVDLVGSPGSAKTTILRAVLTSYHCIHVENISKLISGYKKTGDPEKDCSFIARANKKTWITCEFDTILTSPQYIELMGKIRRIFDGETSSTYANSDEDRVYKGLRTPWVRAGTWKMVDHDQSQLGDRFLRIIINDPNEEDKRAAARCALRSERVAMLESCDETAGSVIDSKTRLAYSLTGGYVDWLRANIERELQRVDMSPEAEERCLDLAELSADLRARPNDDKRKKGEPNDGKELPTRLARQYARLAYHLAVVLNKRNMDGRVLQIVRKVALDTAHGHSLNIVRWLCSPNPSADGVMYQESGGLSLPVIMNWCNMTEERMLAYLMFLRKIDIVRLERKSNTAGMWVLTDRVYDLYLRVMRSHHVGI